MNDLRASPGARADALDFIVGQNRRGLWLAVETHGKGGGLFVSREDALRFAAKESRKSAVDIRLAAEPIELTI